MPSIRQLFRQSKIFRSLLIIVIIKFAIFYLFLKAFLYPRYLKPKWDSEEQRIEAITNDLTKNQKE
ncbi:MAG: DUF4492 domain-containing protein [Bacteroidales bacterium]|jgi:F0F1-type ATP synthase membrane subunit b/b'|nr:DUF4492 domain-containing protein [Bacteroidales bacterium]